MLARIGRTKRIQRWVQVMAVFSLVLAVLLIGGSLLARGGGSTAYGLYMVQDNVEPEVVVAPANLGRLSWGAVLAGSVIAMMVQLGLNLLGIAVGMTSLVPDYGEEGAKPQSLAMGAAVWIGFSTLVALFLGGWLAARFAGIPDQVDGMLHGLMVWGIVMLVSLFLLGSTLGRVISGVSSLLGHGLNLAGQATGAVARGVGNIAQGVAQGASNLAQDAAATVSNTVQNAVDQTPEVSNAMRRVNASIENILNDARGMLQNAVPQPVEGEVRGAVQEMKWAAQDALEHPEQAEQTIGDALRRVLQRGQNLADQADRDAVIQTIMERGNMTEHEAKQTLDQWEMGVNQARQELERARKEAQSKVQQLQAEAEEKLDEAKHEAERVAREAAQATTEAIARIAAAVFAAIVIGAIAAGVGGLVGAPENIPSVDVTDTTSFNGGSQF